MGEKIEKPSKKKEKAWGKNNLSGRFFAPLRTFYVI
jgi:hypothetical protein